MFDFEIMELNLLSGFTFEGVYEHETEVSINGVKQEEKGKLYEIVLYKKGVKASLFVEDNEVFDIDFSPYSFGEHKEGD